MSEYEKTRFDQGDNGTLTKNSMLARASCLMIGEAVDFHAGAFKAAFPQNEDFVSAMAATGVFQVDGPIDGWAHVAVSRWK